MSWQSVPCPFPCGPAHLVELIVGRIEWPDDFATAIALFDGTRCRILIEKGPAELLRGLRAEEIPIATGLASAVLHGVDTECHREADDQTGLFAVRNELQKRAPVLDVLLITGRSWRSLQCDEPGCCMDGGQTFDRGTDEAGTLRPFFRQAWGHRFGHDHRQPSDQQSV